MIEQTTPPALDLGDRDIMIRSSEVIVFSKMSDGTTNVIISSGIQINVTDCFDRYAHMAATQIEPTWLILKLAGGAA